MALGAFAMVVVLTVLTIIARNGYGRANPLRRFRRLLPPRGSTSGVRRPRSRRCERCKAKIETGVSGGSFGGDGNSQGGGVKASGRNAGLREDFRERRLLPVWLDHDQVREVFLE